MHRENEPPQEQDASILNPQPEHLPARSFQGCAVRLLERAALYGCLAAAIFVLLGCILYTPLILAGCEYFLLGTSYVEDFFRAIGLHELLGRIYEPVIDILQSIFHF